MVNLEYLSTKLFFNIKSWIPIKSYQEIHKCENPCWLFYLTWRQISNNGFPAGTIGEVAYAVGLRRHWFKQAPCVRKGNMEKNK